MRFTLKTLMLLLVGLGLIHSADAATFTASLDRDEMTLGESATLSLTFEGGSPNSVPNPAVAGLQINQVGSSQKMTIVNGAMNAAITVSFSVTPQHEGDFTIPALTADVAGQQLSTEPLKFRVSKATAPSAEAVNSGNEVAFLKLNLPRQKLFTGESTVMRLELYLRDEVQNFGNFEITSGNPDGFSVGKAVELPNQRRRVQVGNRVFTMIPYSLALTAVKIGEHPLGPLTVNVVIVLPGGFFGEQRQLTLATEAVNVETLPLPAENRPASFAGAIGDFTMTATAGPTAVTVGDPITVRVQISGRGSLDTITLPVQDAWRDFKTYPPTAKLETSDPFGQRGRKTFEQIVSPLNSDVHELPPLAFSFFNPDDGKYHTLTQAAVSLTVHTAAASPLPALAAKSATQDAPPPPDILPLKENLGALEANARPLVACPAFLAAQALPVLALLAAFVWRRRTDSLANNPRLRRQRAVAQLVRDGVTDLKKFAAENKPDDFFALLFRLLQEQLGERLDCPATAITENVIDENAKLRGAPGPVRDGLRELFQLCNQARYAPVRGTGELNSVTAKLEQTIAGLQEVKA